MWLEGTDEWHSLAGFRGPHPPRMAATGSPNDARSAGVPRNKPSLGPPLTLLLWTKAVWRPTRMASSSSVWGGLHSACVRSRVPKHRGSSSRAETCLHTCLPLPTWPWTSTPEPTPMFPLGHLEGRFCNGTFYSVIFFSFLPYVCS